MFGNCLSHLVCKVNQSEEDSVALLSCLSDLMAQQLSLAVCV